MNWVLHYSVTENGDGDKGLSVEWSESQRSRASHTETLTPDRTTGLPGCSENPASLERADEEARLFRGANFS